MMPTRNSSAICVFFTRPLKKSACADLEHELAREYISDVNHRCVVH
jgi:hypothetical protein